MLFDAGFEGSLNELSEWAQRVEESGLFDAAWISDTSNDPFLLCQLIAHSTSRLKFGTNIAVAFARSPYCVAQTSSNLAALSGGRFTLGLGTQVRAHINKRFNTTWPSHPVEALEEYVRLLRHLFDCFQKRQTPNFRGEHYSCTLSSPVFTPDPHPHGPPAVGFSAVGPHITAAAGRLAEAVFLHPFTHRKFIEEVTLPALRQGQSERDPGLGKLQLVGSCFTIATDSPQAERRRAVTLERLAFYASTPNYKKVLACLGLEELHQELHSLSRQGRWKEMSQLLPEEMIEQCVVAAPTNRLLQAVQERFEGLYDRVVIEPGPFL